MKKLNFLICIIFILSFPLGVLALNAPIVDPVPSQINADLYTFTIHVPAGSTVSVLGGPSNIAPVTDGAGSDTLDGVVEVLVGLAQEQVNIFSIIASRNGEFSDSVEVAINETSMVQSGPSLPGDHTPPDAPLLDSVENPVKAYEYMITGSAESNANIYVKRPDGSSAGSTKANSNGLFEITVELVVGKTNRFNVSAEDAANNVGPSSQIVIQAVEPDTPAVEPEDEPTKTPEEFFPDVPEYHQNKAAIKYLKDHGFVGGYPDGTFQPSKSVNRAEFTKIIVGAKLGRTPSASLAYNCFPDVKESDWYASYVCYAKDQGIISGYPDGEFKPGNTINLAEASKILVNTLSVEKVKPTGTAWYSEFLESLSALNYLPTSFIELSQNVNRGEMSEMIWRILEEIQDKGAVDAADLR